MINFKDKNTQSFIIVICLFVFLAVFFGYKNEKPSNDIVTNTENNSGVDNPPDHALNLDEAIKNQPNIKLFSPLTSPLDLSTVDGKEFCFAGFSFDTWNDGSYHINGGKMRLKVQGVKVTGSSDYGIAGKDTWYGKYDGTVGALDPKTLSRALDLWEVSSSEGMVDPKSKVKFVLFGDRLVGFNNNGVEYAQRAVLCSELNEWEGVNKLLLDKQFFNDYTVINYEDNTGYMMTSYFPDASGNYTQQKKNFTYITNDKHEVLDVKIK
ncbi:MAG: hypothetical protein WCI76_02590 [bacterium]